MTAMNEDLFDDRADDDVPTMTKSELIGRLAEKYPQHDDVTVQAIVQGDAAPAT